MPYLDPLAGIPLHVGAVGDNSFPFETPYPLDGYTPRLWDIYEGASPMANGRVWQMRTDHIVFPPADDVEWLLPITNTPQRQINGPVIYERESGDGYSDGLYTCFAIDDAAGEIGFFRGRFRPLSGQDIPPYYLPVIVTSSEASGTFLSTYSSGIYSWTLCSSGDPVYGGSGITTRPYVRALSVDAGSVAFNQRLATRVVPGGWSMAAGDPFGYISNAPLLTKASTGEAWTGPDARTYRRGADSAVYDWPGVFPF